MIIRVYINSIKIKLDRFKPNKLIRVKMRAY